MTRSNAILDLAKYSQEHKSLLTDLAKLRGRDQAVIDRFLTSNDYPAELQREGLEAALEDLLAPCAAKGLETHLEVDDGDLPADVERLFFRAAQEALRPRQARGC